MAYRAEIEVGVRGAQQLQDLREKINALSKGIDLVNTKTFFGTNTVASIRNYNSALADAQENLNKTRLRLNEAGAAAGNYAKAIDQYVTALQSSNGAQELTNRLIAEEIELRRKQKLAASGIRETTQYSGPIGPGEASPIGALVGQTSPAGERIQRLLDGKREQLELDAALLELNRKSAQQLNERIQLQNSLVAGAREVYELVAAYNREAATGIRPSTQYAGPIGPGPASPIDALVGQSSPVGGRVERIRELETAAIAAANAVSDLAQKQDSEITQKELENDERVFQQKLKRLVRLGQKQIQIDKMVNDEALRDFDRRLAARQPKAGFKTEGPLASPGFKAMQKRIGGLGESLALGAGFPLLFGGGPGSVIGSVLGSFVGSGFGGQILGGALGQSLDQAVQAAAELGNSFALVGDNYSSLREQGIAFTAEIERQVVAAKELGNFTQAQELVRGAVFQQTGDIGGVQAQAAATSVNELQKSWDGVTKAVQTLLGFLGTPFIFVLTAILRAVQGITALVNLAVSGVIKLAALIPWLKDKMDKAYEASLRNTAGYEEQLAAVNKQINALSKSLELEETRTNLKRRMIGASKEEQQELEKQLKVEELRHALSTKIAEIRAASPGQTDEQLAKVEELVKAETAVYGEKVKQLNIDLQIKQAKEYELKLEKQRASQIKANAMLAEGVVTATTTRLQNQVSIASAANSAYLALNALEMQRAKNAGDTEKQYQLQLQRAQLIYQQTILQVKQEERKAKLAVISSQIKLKELEATVAQKAAKGEALAQDYAAVELQKQAVQLAYEGVSAAQQIAQYNLMGAQAVRTMAIEQAKFNQNKAAGAAIGGGGGGGGGGMGAGGVMIAGITGTQSFGALTPEGMARTLAERGVSGVFSPDQAASLINAQNAAYEKGLNAALRESRAMRYSSAGQAVEADFRANFKYAEGGFVTRPTNALVGEGGQPEYVIPASKMNDAMRRYSAGTRGEAVVNGAGASGGMSSTTNYSNQQNAYYGGGGGTSVNITTGPVIRMNNRDYVTMADMQRGMAAAANAGQANMMRQLGRSYAARRSMGL